MPRVAHVITTLDVGGAERLLADVIRHTDDTVLAVSLRRPGPVAGAVTDAGVAVRSLDLRRTAAVPTAVHRLAGWLREERIDVVQTWMYHADLIGGAAARRAGIGALAWSIHASDLTRGLVPRRTLAIRAVNARLSHRWPQAVVCTSQRTLALHASFGYATARMRVIRNGFAVKAPSTAAGRRLRRELGIAPDDLVLARVGRLDPQKGWGATVAVWQKLLAHHPRLHVLGCGRGVVPDTEVFSTVTRGPAADRLHLLGERDDVDAIHAAADVAMSTSAFGESFPLVIGEAMAAVVPVVATDVGGCAELVGDTGAIVPPGDVAGLTREVDRLLADPERRRTLGARARQRIAERFTIEETAAAYAALHRELAERRR